MGNAQIVDSQSLLTELVKQWAERAFPEHDGAAEKASAAARLCYMQGSSITEACEKARSVLASWGDHPSVELGSTGQLSGQLLDVRPFDEEPELATVVQIAS